LILLFTLCLANAFRLLNPSAGCGIKTRIAEELGTQREVIGWEYTQKRFIINGEKKRVWC
jgi:hypothetical protein